MFQNFLKDDVLNTRVKDFYDIYKMYNMVEDKDKLKEYFSKMIEYIGKISATSVDPSFLNEEYIKKHNHLWQGASRRYDFIDKDVCFADAVNYTKTAIDEVLEMDVTGPTLSRKYFTLK